MEGGAGEASYVQNSGFQGSSFALASSALRNAINNLYTLNSAKVIKITDLGCSSGPNSIIAMNFIVKTLKERYNKESLELPEFQAYFSDQSFNDFNTLFTMLPSPDYFSAGVPGSFYDKLFPSSSIHIATSNMASHWLSEVPPAVVEKNWNTSKVWAKEAKPKVALAYEQQAHRDLCRFLDKRASEMVPGGIMFLSSLGRVEKDPAKQYPDRYNITDWLEGAWNDLIAEGILEQDTIDSYNLPIYFRHVSDFEKALEETKDFKLIHSQCIQVPLASYPNGRSRAELIKFARKESMMSKSLYNSSIVKHLNGNMTLVENLWQKVEQKVLEDENIPDRAVTVLLTTMQKIIK